MYIVNVKNEGLIGSEQVYECENDDIHQIDSKLKRYKCYRLNYYELYNVHVESAEI